MWCDGCFEDTEFCRCRTPSGRGHGRTSRWLVKLAVGLMLARSRG